MYLSYFYQSSFIDYYPVLFFTRQLNKKLTATLPHLPITILSSWDVSKLQCEYLQLKNSQNDLSNALQNKLDDILIAVSNLIHRDSISEEQFLNMRTAIAENEKEVSFRSKVTGFFSFVNLIWLISIIGIGISFGPFVYHITLPLRQNFFHIVQYIYYNVLIPSHEHGVFEVLSYIFCSMMIVEGYRYKSESGFPISISGLFWFYSSFVYSFALHPINYSRNDTIPSLNFILFCITNIPLTLNYNSQLLAWITTVFFNNAIGFSAIPVGLGWYIGFESHDAMIQNIIISLIIGAFYIITTIFNCFSKFTKVFKTALTAFSSISLFLGMLIFSSRYYQPYYRYDYNYTSGYEYILRQLAMISLLLIYLFFSYVYSINGMRNTAIVFSILYTVEKIIELNLRLNASIWFITLPLFVALYYASLYLHSNKEFVVSLFNYDLEQEPEVTTKQ